MISQRDIYATAQVLIRKHGKGADDYAHVMMLSFMEIDDLKGAGIWLCIGQAIEDLQNKKAQGKLH